MFIPLKAQYSDVKIKIIQLLVYVNTSKGVAHVLTLLLQSYKSLHLNRTVNSNINTVQNEYESCAVYT